MATAQTHPQPLGCCPYGHWTLDRLTDYVNQTMNIPISRSQLGEIFGAGRLEGVSKPTSPNALTPYGSKMNLREEMTLWRVCL